LANLSALADAWQQKLVAPAEQALAERARVREEIAQYKKEHGFS
jgi:chorismate mutase